MKFADAQFKSTVFLDREVTRRASWLQRVIQPLSDLLTQALGENGTNSFTTYQSGWTRVPGYSDLQYRLQDGWVYLDGAVSGGTIGTVATLPAAYRPGFAHNYTSSGYSGTQGCARILILASGNIQVAAFSDGATNAFVSFAGMRFQVGG